MVKYAMSPSSFFTANDSVNFCSDTHIIFSHVSLSAGSMSSLLFVLSLLQKVVKPQMYILPPIPNGPSTTLSPNSMHVSRISLVHEDTYWLPRLFRRPHELI